MRGDYYREKENGKTWQEECDEKSLTISKKSIWQGDEKMKKVPIGIELKKCRKCQMMNYAMRVMHALEFEYSNANIAIGEEPNFRSALEFDRYRQEILINEELLMQAIILANPGQERRRIRLITDEEFKKRKSQRTRIIKERPDNEPQEAMDEAPTKIQPT